MLQPKFNKYPKPTDWNSLIILAQQAFEDGFRAPTFTDLVAKVSELVSVLGGTGIVPTVEPNTTLPSPAQPAKIMIMKGGSYTQPDGVTPLEAPANSFNVGYWDGEEWSVDISIETEADLSSYAKSIDLDATQDDVSMVISENYEVVTDLPTKPFISGGYINGVNGGTVSNAGWHRTSATNTANMFVIAAGKRYYYTGEVSPDVSNPAAFPVGVAFYDSEGDFIDYDCRDVSVYNQHRLTPPVGAAFMSACSYGGEATITEEELSLRIRDTVFVDQANSESGSGTADNPYQTIGQAIASVAARPTQYRKILISQGDYRETLDLAALPSGDYDIRGREGHRVRVLRSTKLQGWTKTGGRTNVYEVEYSGSIATWATRANPIFEDGRPSAPITAEHQHPLQRGLSHRLPFTPIYEVSDVDTVDSTPGTYCRISGILYVHPSNSDDPSTNGYSYETIIGQPVNTFNDPSTTSKTVNIKMANIQFMFNPSGLIIAGFNRFVGINLVSLAGLGSGRIRPDTGVNTLINCEAGYGDVDGFNGHFSRFSGFDSLLDNRSNSPMTQYIGCWAHDNGDDGESSHEQHTVFIESCIFEHNGDSGCRVANDANYMIRNSISRHNGWEVGSGGADRGEGFAAVGSPINPARAGVRILLINCISEANNTGFGIASGGVNNVIAINCASRNNTTAEYYAGSGAMTLKNCKASNADPGKVKVTTGGTIVVENDAEVI